MIVLSFWLCGIFSWSTPALGIFVIGIFPNSGVETGLSPISLEATSVRHWCPPPVASFISSVNQSLCQGMLRLTQPPLPLSMRFWPVADTGCYIWKLTIKAMFYSEWRQLLVSATSCWSETPKWQCPGSCLAGKLQCPSMKASIGKYKKHLGSPCPSWRYRMSQKSFMPLHHHVIQWGTNGMAAQYSSWNTLG